MPSPLLTPEQLAHQRLMDQLRGSVQPISTRDAALMQGANAGSGVIDPTRTATDPAEIERIRQQNQGYGWDLASALTGHPTSQDTSLLGPNSMAQWATILFPGIGGKGLIPDQMIQSHTPGITIVRQRGNPPWSWMGEPTTRGQYRQQGMHVPPAYVHYVALNRRGEAVGGMTLSFKKHASGRVTVNAPHVWTAPLYNNSRIIEDLMTVPQALRSQGMHVHVPRSQLRAHRVMHG